MQAASCAVPSGRNGGCASVQGGAPNTQRGWNRQPGGSAAADGTAPSIASNRSRALLQPRHAAQQPQRVGMLRIVEQRLCGGMFHHAAGVHHRHLIRHLGHDPKVVGD